MYKLPSGSPFMFGSGFLKQGNLFILFFIVSCNCSISQRGRACMEVFKQLRFTSFLLKCVYMMLAIIHFALLKTSITSISLQFTCRSNSIGDTLNYTISDTVPMPPSKSCVIADSRMKEIFNDTIVASHCHPKQLFTVKTRSGGGATYTSDWSSIRKFSATLSLIFDETNGQSLTHRPLDKQLDTYLRAQKPPQIWSSADLDESCDFLRCRISYRVKYTESESDIQINNLLYKNTQNVKTLSIFLIF